MTSVKTIIIQPTKKVNLVNVVLYSTVLRCRWNVVMCTKVNKMASKTGELSDCELLM